MIWDFFKTNSDALQTISTLLMVLITLSAVLYAIKQVNEAKKQVDEAQKTRILSAYLTFESRLINEHAREARKYLYENSFENPSAITPADKEVLERICTTFDILGVLVREDLMYRPLVFKPFYDVIIKCWEKTYDFIDYERKPTRKAQTYMQDFEYLYEQAEKYRKEHNFPPVKIHPPHTGKAPIVPSPKNKR